MLRHVIGQNLDLSSTPIKLVKKHAEIHAEKFLRQKQYLAGEVGEKMFNPTLMNKLIRIE